jgi:hypothetical protein
LIYDFFNFENYLRLRIIWESAVPWAAWPVGIALGLVAIPAIGQYVAVIIVFAIAAPLGFALLPLAQAAQNAGMTETQSFYVGAVILAAGVLAIAVLIVGRLLRSDITPREEAACINWLILVIGIPLVIAMSFWQLRGMFG